jgi:hypothetical protein
MTRPSPSGRGPAPRPRTLRPGAAALAALLLAACGGAKPDADGAAAASLDTVALDRVVAWEGELALEESDEVLNVLPRVSVDPRGGFLVADEQESQVRRYGPDGKLLFRFGRRGGGPREFTFLHRALRLPGGEVLALDTYNRGALFDAAGDSLLRTLTFPVGPVHAAEVLDDTLLLLGGKLSGRGFADPDARLHLWSLARDTLVRSFFTPAVRGRARTLAANTAGFVSTAVRGDTIAATFSLSDTVYLFDRRGRALGKVPVPFRGFRRLDEDAPLPGRNGGVVQAREWVGTFSLVSDLFWLADGTFVVQYQDREGPEPRWRLLRMTRDGRRLFESRDTPRLLAADPASGSLYFVTPGSETPNRWSRARFVR